MIDDATAILAKAGTLETLQFTPSGPAGAFAVYLPPGQLLGRAFLNEFITVDSNGASVICLILFDFRTPFSELLFGQPWTQVTS